MSIFNSLAFAQSSAFCRPPVNTNLPQFIVGYGSLMQEESKRESSEAVEKNLPIYIKGFKRAWIERGTKIGFSTTYLGVVKRPKGRINAVYFKLKDSNAIRSYDKREDTYCRVRVSPGNIVQLTKKKLPKGQYWIYITTAPQQFPSHRFPIVQSYVDIFLSGCFEIERKFHLKNFARDCIRTTHHWSGEWVNDRIHPRRAFDDLPYAAQIDTLISAELPGYFKQIRIE